MPLPPDFVFSQNSLQTFLECPRRFELAFIERARWPAPQAEPLQEHERRLRAGAQFHQLVFQQAQGLPPEALSASIRDPDLARWWRNYLDHAPSDLPENRRAEYELSIPFATYRLMARFDLLAWEPGRRAVIVDWKTAFTRPDRTALAARVQTRLYPFVLANAACLHGDTPPEQITMLYWFPGFPYEPAAFPYSAGQMEEDRLVLTRLVEAAAGTPEGGFLLTENLRACRFCRYRSLCGRGSEAGAVDEEDGFLDEGASLFDGIDPDRIAGIAF